MNICHVVITLLQKENIEGTDMYGAAKRNKEQIIPDPCSHSDLLDDMFLQCGKFILKDGDNRNLQYRFMPLVLTIIIMLIYSLLVAMYNLM